MKSSNSNTAKRVPKHFHYRGYQISVFSVPLGFWDPFKGLQGTLGAYIGPYKGYIRVILGKPLGYDLRGTTQEPLIILFSLNPQHATASVWLSDSCFRCNPLDLYRSLDRPLSCCMVASSVWGHAA